MKPLAWVCGMKQVSGEARLLRRKRVNPKLFNMVLPCRLRFFLFSVSFNPREHLHPHAIPTLVMGRDRGKATPRGL